MGWFDEQIRQRKLADDAAFEESFAQIADSILGTKLSKVFSDDRIKAKNAIDEILKYYHIKPKEEIPESLTDVNEQLEYIMRPHGIMRRVVKLTDGWYKDAVGPMLGVRLDNNQVTALIPTGLVGYSYYDAETGKLIKINRRNAGIIDKEGLCFYRSFPLRKMGIPDLLKFITDNLSVADMVLFGIATLIVTLVGMLEPKIAAYLTGDVIQIKKESLLFAISIFYICVIISKLLLDSMKSILNSRIMTKIDLNVVSATMMRILSLPAKFFKKYSSGELTSRTDSMSTLCSMLISTLLSTGLTSVFSLVYIKQIFDYAPGLVVPAILVILATLVLTIVTAVIQQNYSKQSMELSAKDSGIVHALLTGIQKIKLSGSEKRAFARWADIYSKESKLQYNPSKFIVLNGVISTSISLLGEVALWSAAIKTGVTASNFYAFSAAYGMVSAAFMSLASAAITIANIKPVLDMVRPILEEVPEISENKQVITRLSGGIEVNNVSFRYTDNQPMIIDNLSLKINPGQYIAICGSTGCGKSTLIRLMLGFETPLKGAVYYDGKDLSTIDMRSLRRKIGTVMQDGKLLQGDIYSNIVISAPQLPMADAWEAAEIAGIADDIRQMPMGMFTVLSEGAGGISGGQRQRLMIARAIAPKPKILIFDEATSALDNVTQKKISDALDKLKCTRIVIAHRLSTIRQCDRIIVLDQGHIMEDGTYDELIKQNGFFAELVRRQQITKNKPETGTETKDSSKEDQ